MCQLLGMNCNVPTDISFSFRGFCARGGMTDEHKDGWGIAFFEGRGCRTFLDTTPSATSSVAQFVRSYPIKSKNVIAHIRKATIGEISLENTHPFTRELWGRHWVFAHNGDLKDYHPELDGTYCPVGTTDSERAFCFMLEALRSRFGGKAPEPNELHEALVDIVPLISKHGPFNFLLSNGKTIVAHGSTKLAYVVRQAPFSEAHLIDEDISVDFSTVTTPTDRIAVIATTPLTRNEQWKIFAPGELITFVDGNPAYASKLSGPA